MADKALVRLRRRRARELLPRIAAVVDGLLGDTDQRNRITTAGCEHGENDARYTHQSSKRNEGSFFPICVFVTTLTQHDWFDLRIASRRKARRTAAAAGRRVKRGRQASWWPVRRPAGSTSARR